MGRVTMSHQCSDDLTFPAYVLPSNQGRTPQTSPSVPSLSAHPRAGVSTMGKVIAGVGVDQLNLPPATTPNRRDIESKTLSPKWSDRDAELASARFIRVQGALAQKRPLGPGRRTRQFSCRLRRVITGVGRPAHALTHESATRGREFAVTCRARTAGTR